MLRNLKHDAKYLKKRGAEPRNIPFAKVLEAKLNALSGVKHLPWQLCLSQKGRAGPEQEGGGGGGGRVCLGLAARVLPRTPVTSSARFPNKVIADMEAQVHRLREELVSVNSQRKQQLVELGLLREEEKQRAARDHEAAVSKLKAESEKMRLELKKSHAAETELTLEKVGGRAGGSGPARTRPRPPPGLPGSPLGAVAWSRPPVYDPSRCAVCTSRASLTHPRLPEADRWKTPCRVTRDAPSVAGQQSVGSGVEWRPLKGLGFVPCEQRRPGARARGGQSWAQGDQFNHCGHSGRG